ncbi:histone H2B.3-like [Pristis pectinata]|uniref:histone H2B.3-like n=1 Tax=Pristis pectinata TaxID=685728 RepID=UPI00223E809E|nr:histone H2B.3-like [Pristis pectinata]
MKSATKCQQTCGLSRAEKKTTSFKRKTRYSSYIYRMLKQVHSEHGFIEFAQMNSSLEQIATEAARLSLYNKRRTITSQEVCRALRHIPRQ